MSAVVFPQVRVDLGHAGVAIVDVVLSPPDSPTPRLPRTFDVKLTIFTGDAQVDPSRARVLADAITSASNEADRLNEKAIRLRFPTRSPYR